MKINLNGLTRNLNRFGLTIKKHSPEILMVAGTVGVVTSAVMACKATLKVNDILDEAKDNIDKIHNVAEDKEFADRYSEEDSKKDLAIVYAQTGIKLVKLYGPSILLGALSIGAMISSNRILTKRNIALAAAYTAVDTGFKDYRKNVVERFGEKVDKELKHNIKAKTFETVTVDENGKEKKTKEEVDVCNGISDFARFFDEGSKYFTKDPEYNLMFLKMQQNYANDKLKSKGYLFLNDVYRMLDIPETKAGQIVGWFYDEDHPTGDNYVDFGIYNTNREKCRDFVNGYESVILLDFNVDGNILEYI